MSEEKMDVEYKVSNPASLIVNNISGSVVIRPGAEGVIHVTTNKVPGSGDEKRTEIEITQEPDGTVKVSTRFPEAGWSWLFGSHPCDVDYIISAPTLCSLKLNGVSNTVSAQGFSSACEVNSVSGNVSLHDLAGATRIHTVSGDIEAERLKGLLDLDTVSGDLDLRAAALASINAKTVSGDLQISTPLTDGPYSFKSVSGDVKLIVPADTRCTADLHSLSGDLVSALPVSGLHQHPGSQEVKLQGGGVLVSLHSVSGDLSLDNDSPIPTAAPVDKPLSAEERRAVLESLERGELSAAEALVKLNG